MKKTAFRFPLGGEPGNQVFNVNDLLGLHLRELCDLLVPLNDGRDLRIDGYRMLNDRNTVHPLYTSEGVEMKAGFEPIDLYEPRIGYIRHVLESLLNIIDLEADGKVTSVDGFRLKDPNKWLSPSGGATDILAHAASRCNLDCLFCYNRHAPDTLKPAPIDPVDEYREIQERISYYVPSSRLNIFPNMGSPAEALAHPHILDILTELRRKTEESFRIPTNGSTLTRDMIKALKAFSPVSLDISLNSASPLRRESLMGDKNPRIALGSLKLLREAGIPFSVVIVPWPVPSNQVMLEDLKNTVSFADAFDPIFIQVNLPGCAQPVSKKSLFPHEEVWDDLTKETQGLRRDTDCPLIIRPGLYEEYTDPDRVNAPTVAGVIKNSPARAAGLAPGDHIVKVNGLPVKTRYQTRSLLTVLHESEIGKASLSIKRDGIPHDLDLDLSDFAYPYSPVCTTHLGVVFSSSGIPREWLEMLKQVVLSHRAKEVLVLSSSLIRPTLERMISVHGSVSDVRLHIRVPQNGYFGGNVFMGDLMVVEDFIEAIEGFSKETRIQPDLVVIPSSPFHLSGWGRDLTGRVYLDIERHTGIPVVLVECEPIFD